MARTFRLATMALAIAALVGGAVGARRVAADPAAAGWRTGFDDGCGYYHDGFSSYTLRACPRVENASLTWLDFFVPVDGRWIYGELSVAWLDSAGTVIYHGGVYYYGLVSAPVTSSGGPTGDLSTSMPVGGGDSNIENPVIFATGGTPYRPWVTYNPVVDRLWGVASSGTIDGWTAPTCVYRDHNVCIY